MEEVHSSGYWCLFFIKPHKLKNGKYDSRRDILIETLQIQFRIKHLAIKVYFLGIPAHVEIMENKIAAKNAAEYTAEKCSRINFFTSTKNFNRIESLKVINICKQAGCSNNGTAQEIQQKTIFD